jgi:hypothetical protein
MNSEIEKISTDLAVQAHDLRVVDQASANRATQLVLLGKDAIKKIKAFFMPLKQAQDEAKRKLLEREKAELAKVEPIVTTLSSAIAEWRAAEERKRIAAEAEQRRQEAEKRRLEEEALRKAREAEAAAERERLRLERENEDLRRREAEALRAGDEKTLEAIEEKREEIRQEAHEILASVEMATNQAINEAAKAEAAMTPAPVIPIQPKTPGLAMRDNWEFKVEDPSVVPRAYLCVDEKLIGQVVRATKGKITIPGVRIFYRPIMAEVSPRGKKSIGV